MFKINKQGDIEDNYKLMVNTIKIMLEDESDIIANLSNISSVINIYVDKLNWVGFYLLKGNELVLGPFQGKPACIRIKVGKGVCGKCVKDEKTMVVKNVHEYPGHIACDTDTNSEMVIPLYKNKQIYGVLDLDSTEINRFTDLEIKYLSIVADVINNFLSDK